MGTVDGPIIVVLKVEMHCEDCAMQVRRSVKGFKGVEAAASDILESKLTVIGKVDPFKLRSHVESKTHKKVELIYPATIAVTKEAEGHVGVKAEKPDKDQKNADGNRPNVPNSATSVVVLKVQLHCKGCTQRLIKQIYKIKGVDSVSVDSAKDLVTVKGTMDVKNLPGFLTAKLRKAVEIVDLKKDGDGDHKEKNEKKDNGDAGKKEGQVTAAATNVTAMDASKMDYYVGGAYGFYQYRMEIVEAPQIFSDENPNACSIM